MNEKEKLLKAIHRLALRLPWLVVIVVFIVVVITLLEVFFSRSH